MTDEQHAEYAVVVHSPRHPDRLAGRGTFTDRDEVVAYFEWLTGERREEMAHAAQAEEAEVAQLRAENPNHIGTNEDRYRWAREEPCTYEMVTRLVTGWKVEAP